MSDLNNSLSAAWTHGYERLARRIKGCLPSGQDLLILELGCGMGPFTIPLANNIMGRIVAVDCSEKKVIVLKELLKRVGLENRVEVVAEMAEGLGNGKGGFDAVVSNFFMGWVDLQKAAVIAETIRKNLNEGGVVVHSDFIPIADNPAQKIAVEQGKAENNEEPSVKWWMPFELSEFYEKAGFSDMDVAYFDWKIKFEYPLAVEQLRRWKAKADFIKKSEKDLKRHGMELPRSFIFSARKPVVGNYG